MKNFLGCTIANVGNSTNISKTIKIDEKFECPATLYRPIWIGGYRLEEYDITYLVNQTANHITVTRTDNTGMDIDNGWTMDLKFRCCPKNGEFIGGSLYLSDATIKTRKIQKFYSRFNQYLNSI